MKEESTESPCRNTNCSPAKCGHPQEPTTYRREDSPQSQSQRSYDYRQLIAPLWGSLNQAWFSLNLVAGAVLSQNPQLKKLVDLVTAHIHLAG